MLNRRNFLKQSLLGAGALALGGAAARAAHHEKPNVLFIAVDDLNDWVGCFGGHPQAKTPHLDAFAKNGGMVFSRAYCPSTVCCPSRSAIMTGIRPSTSGVYGNGNNMRNAPRLENAETIPEYFSRNGYFTTSRGKIYHKHPAPDGGIDERQETWDEWVPTSTKGAKNPDTSKGPANGLLMVDGSLPKGNAKAFDWGVTSGIDEGTKDYQTALWARGVLEKEHDKPFFLAVGISKPHLPWFVPRKYYDLYPLEDTIVPEYRLDDLDDIKNPNGENKYGPSDDFLRVQKYGKFKEAAQAYLAAVSYADDCVGVVLDALDQSKYRDNTIVAIWGDHGWFLGEKLKYRKTHLWEESARAPLIVKAPGATQPGESCSRVVNLIDLYPTLVALCGLKKKEGLEARSFAPLLKDPKQEWPYPTLTTYQKGNHAIRDERWRYIRYADGVEELYDHDRDPMEWENLADRTEHAQLKAKLAKWMPAFDAGEIPKNTGEKKKKGA